ncbi:MAG: PqiC family protein [Candidatus Thiodiazotropha sp. (ex Dulcina madagascariensis)]|nr:PqiC family protein [Candidatus Thiodiazotropha sp. (ex Dulcina madagascariensis)]
MTILKINPLLLILVVSSALLLAGCATPSQPTRFYRLDGQLPVPETVSLKPRTGVPLIGLGPVRLAGYLDRPQIVMRLSPHRLALREFDQWAGSLQENIQQVVSDSLRRQLEEMQLVTHPWHGSVRPDYEVHLLVRRLDQENGKIRLQARWSLIEAQGNRLAEMQQVAIEENVTGDDVEAGVAAANRAMARLARRIAAGIRSQTKT